MATRRTEDSTAGKATHLANGNGHAAHHNNNHRGHASLGDDPAAALGAQDDPIAGRQVEDLLAAEPDNVFLQAAAAAKAALLHLESLIPVHNLSDAERRDNPGRLTPARIAGFEGTADAIAARPEVFATRKKGKAPTPFDLTTARSRLSRWHALDDVASVMKRVGHEASDDNMITGQELGATLGKVAPLAQAITATDENIQSLMAPADKARGKGAATRRKNQLPAQRAAIQAAKVAKQQAQLDKVNGKIAAATAALDRAKARAEALKKK